jgi:hypothetical protein
MRSTNSIIYAKAAIGNSMGAGASVVISTIPVLTEFGFAKDVAAISSVMDVGNDFSILGTDKIVHNGAPTPATCSIKYTAPTTAAGVPIYLSDLTGC